MRLRRRLDRRLIAKALQGRRQLQERVVAERGHRGVAGPSPGPDQEPEHPLLADAERVEAPAADMERDPAALVEDVVGANLLGMLAAKPLRPRGGSHLLVGGRDDEQLARPGRQPSLPSAAAAATSAAT